MKLRTNSKVVKWAYLFSDYVPHQTSICPLFWRCVLVTPAILSALAGVIGVAIYGFVILPIKELGWPGSLVVPLIVTIVYLAGKIGDLTRRRRWEQLEHPTEPSVVREFIKATKSKICPIVTLED